MALYTPTTAGFAPYLLRDLSDLAGQNYPAFNITPAGFLELLLEHTNISGVRLVEENGHIKSAQVKYAQRISPSLVAENDTCDIDFVPAYKEAAINAVRIAKLGFYISLDTVAHYMESASQKINIPGSVPATSALREIVDNINLTANAMIGKVDQRLLGDVDWGRNVVYGDDAVHDLNINKDATVFNLDEGYGKLLNDAFLNEFNGDLLIAGSGFFNILQLNRTAGVLSANQAGIDLSRFTGYRWYPDVWAASNTNWGGNDIGVFAKGAIHFVDFNKYVGFRAGRLANSTFFRLPLKVGGQTMWFDAQLRELDCPTEVLDVYGTAGMYKEGYVLYLKKTYGLFQIPSDAYATSDRLVGVNGAIHYNVTNVCTTC